MSQHNRVEFTIDNYDKPKVLAFVECTSTGISFGQAKRFVFTDYSLPEPSENYERTTIHKDGNLVTHLAFADNLVEQKSPLGQWNHEMSFMREFYDVGLSEAYLPNPKTDARTKLVAVQLNHLECQIWFAVVPSLEREIVDKLEWFEHPQVQCWRLKNSWPTVIVGISNLKEVSEMIAIESMGIDYRYIN